MFVLLLDIGPRRTNTYTRRTAAEFRTSEGVKWNDMKSKLAKNLLNEICSHSNFMRQNCLNFCFWTKIGNFTDLQSFKFGRRLLPPLPPRVDFLIQVTTGTRRRTIVGNLCACVDACRLPGGKSGGLNSNFQNAVKSPILVQK